MTAVVAGAAPQPRSIRRAVAWALWALTIALSALGGTLVLLSVDVAVPDNWGFRGYWDIVGPTFATAGLLIAVRHPANAIGWILIVGGVVTAFGGFAQEYATYGVLVRPGSLPGVVPIAWLASWSFALFAGPTIMLIPQLFPTGRPLSDRWARLLWAPAVFILGSVVNFGLRPGPLENAAFIDNPVVLTGWAVDLRAALVAPLSFALLTLTVASGAALVVRFRRAEGVERAQLKWMAFAGSATVVAFAVVLIWNTKAAQILMIGAFTTIPVSIVIAILRYRLYEIDLIIRRTLFYGVLTAAMAGVFAASMALLQRIFIAVTGGQSDAAVVLTTLVLVSLFTPIKEQLQRFIDRYFKEPTDATRRLAPYVGELRGYLALQSPDEIARRLVAELVRCLGAEAGAAYLAHGGLESLVHEIGGGGPYAVSLPIGDGSIGRIALAPRSGGRDYRPEDLEAARTAIAVAADAIRLAEARHGR